VHDFQTNLFLHHLRAYENTPKYIKSILKQATNHCIIHTANNHEFARIYWFRQLFLYKLLQKLQFKCMLMTTLRASVRSFISSHQVAAATALLLLLLLRVWFTVVRQMALK